MSNAGDFVIENGVLIEYRGDDTDIVIPDNVVGIGDEAFADCGDICSVVIPDGVTEIGEDAFAWCYELQSIVIPESVADIKWSTFKGCENVTIHAKQGSYAESYANENEFPFSAE